MTYKVILSEYKPGGEMPSKYVQFFALAKSLGATWDNHYLYLPDEQYNCDKILKAASYYEVTLRQVE